MNAHPQLQNFLNPYSDQIQKLSWELRSFLTNLVPEANELIWDNYNAVAIAYSKSEKLKDAFCHIAVYAKHINFGFNRGAELAHKNLKLEGNGKLIRHIKVVDFNTFPKDEITKLILDAITNAELLNPELSIKTSKGKSIVMSISEKKIRPKN